MIVFGGHTRTESDAAHLMLLMLKPDDGGSGWLRTRAWMMLALLLLLRCDDRADDFDNDGNDGGM